MRQLLRPSKQKDSHVGNSRVSSVRKAKSKGLSKDEITVQNCVEVYQAFLFH